MNSIPISFYLENISFQILSLFLIFLTFQNTISATDKGKFQNETNIGYPGLGGSIVHDPLNGTYKITGSGENIWGNKDQFYFLWKKSEGDILFRTELEWLGTGKHEHRKAGIMFRGSLDDDAPYVDAVIHGDGLISMQFRKTKGEITSEVQAPLSGTAKLILEKTGNQFTFYIHQNGNNLIPVGTISVDFGGELFAGLVVCSHDSTTLETAVFSNVKIDERRMISDEKRVIESTLEIMNIETGVRRIVHCAKEHFEAPNWSRDGKTLFYNSGGKIYTLPITGGAPELLNTGFAVNCNNDHGVSPDGNEFVVSHHGEDGKSLIYILSMKDGDPRLITELGPSYWHGWSPDGKILAYCAERNGEYDVYSIPVEGGNETRLTNTPGLDDGPDYSPDGKFIFFNSDRTGQMKIWRMNADGTGQIQITPDDEYGDWFAHPSPDNKWIVFVSYDRSVVGHPPNKNVVLRIIPVTGGEPKIIAHLFGGQGTINVPSWSPDSKEFAFVSYRLVTP